MKDGLRVMARLLCICIVTAILLSVASNILARKDSINKNADFFAQDAPFDALFFGSSHMLNAVLPMELWEEYGIVSYNFAGHGSRMPTNYWIMRNAMDYTKPRVVVIDCYYLSTDILHDEKKEFVHMSLDAFPMSKVKIQTVFDLFESKTDRLSFLWPFSTYHNRWKELTKEDFGTNYSTEKGANIRIGYEQLQKPDAIPREEKYVGESKGVIYLRKMIEYCQQQGIDVVLTYVPFAAAEWAQREANRVYDLAGEYGVEYLSYEMLSDCVDYQTDFCDAGHLNYSGGVKITRYIGNLLAKKYDLTDRKYDAAYDMWQEDARAYKEFKASLLNTQKTAMMFMPLLEDPSIRFALLYNGNNEHAGIQTLLRGLGIWEKAQQDGSSFLVFVDNTAQSCTVVADGESSKTPYGMLEFRADDSGGFAALLNGQQLCTIGKDSDTGFWVTVWESTNREPICTALFRQNGSRG